MSEILITGLVTVVSVAVGFLGSFFLLRKQIVEGRKERARDRKIAAAEQAVHSACELLGAVADFSDMNKAIMHTTQNKANLATLMEQPDLLSDLKAGHPEIHEATTRYRDSLASTWKAYAALRVAFSEKLGRDYVEFTDYLNSLILEDVRAEWSDMLARANVIIDEVKKEIEGD
ncbi:MAG: hypothetical protein ISS70_12530 [Phycisphaerae bacterium]|nr:hypothetical protein [Phycisphaerae bacterium]